MTKRAHTIFCWILAISLVWLPLSVSANVSLQLIKKASCPEMSSTISGHDMHSAMSDQTIASSDSVIDNTMHESMMQKDCCDQCENECVDCNDMSSCNRSSNHASPFTLNQQYFSQPIYLAQSIIEQFVHYQNQIITPDNRPPLV